MDKPCISVEFMKKILSDAPDRPLGAYDELDLCDGRCNYGKQYFPDKILVTGHTTT